MLMSVLSINVSLLTLTRAGNRRLANVKGLCDGTTEADVHFEGDFDAVLSELFIS